MMIHLCARTLRVSCYKRGKKILVLEDGALQPYIAQHREFLALDHHLANRAVHNHKDRISADIDDDVVEQAIGSCHAFDI